MVTNLGYCVVASVDYRDFFYNIAIDCFDYLLNLGLLFDRLEHT